MKANSLEKIKSKIPNVSDFPKPGIQFKDTSALLLDPKIFKLVINTLAKSVKHLKFDAIIGIESRGFWFGIPLANKLKKPFIPVRKKGKLPRPTISATYKLEYGTDTMQIHRDDLKLGQRVLVVDDLIATGGTFFAVSELILQSKATFVAAAVVIELTDLNGRKNLDDRNVPLISLLKI